MKQITQEAKTVSEAVEQACVKLGVGISDVQWEIVDEGSKGFFGIGARPAKVIVTCESLVDEANEILAEMKKAEKKKEFKAEPVKKAEPKAKPEKTKAAAEKPKAKPEKAKPEAKAQEAPAKPEPVAVKAEETVAEENAVSERASLTDADKAAIIDTAVKFLDQIFTSMNMKIEVSAEFIDNKQIVIDLKGEEMGTIIGKRGQTLDSLQYLTNLVVNKGEYPYMNVTLDTEGYRARRKETLEHLAFNLAKKAKHNRRNVSLEPMNPYERRIIHATLQNDRYVTTYSEGVEPYRYVVIALKNSYTARKNRY